MAISSLSLVVPKWYGPCAALVCFLSLWCVLNVTRGMLAGDPGFQGPVVVVVNQHK